jgi:hypothetical protein
MDFTLGLIALLEEQTPIVASLPEFTYPGPTALPGLTHTAGAATFTARPATFTVRPAFNGGPVSGPRPALRDRPPFNASPAGHPRGDADLDEPQRPLSIGETMWRRAQLTQALGRSRVGSAA